MKDPMTLAKGLADIKWAEEHMPALQRELEILRPLKILKGFRIIVTCHLEAKTAALILGLQSLGAIVVATGSNPLSTKDEIVEALRYKNVSVFAKHGCSNEEYNAYLKSALEVQSTMPTIIVDDGGDMIRAANNKEDIVLVGSTEETTTGINILRKLAKRGLLKAPAIATNNSRVKHFFDNKYGTAQSTIDGILRATNCSIAGKVVVVAGYGYCGKGVSMAAKALGANVVVTEVNPIKAIDAVLNGYTVMPMSEAVKLGDIFITVTGCKDVIKRAYYKHMKDGAILCNAGHFDVEITKPTAVKCVTKGVRKGVDAYTLTNGKTIYLLGDGRLVNLACGDGHPCEIMDMSFLAQLESVVYLAKHSKELSSKVYALPEYLDLRMAQIKLTKMHVSLDTISKEQQAYLGYNPAKIYEYTIPEIASDNYIEDEAEEGNLDV